LSLSCFAGRLCRLFAGRLCRLFAGRDELVSAVPSQRLNLTCEERTRTMSTTVTNTVEINAGPDEVWAVLADLPATRMWLPGVVSARMDGDLRVCTTGDGQEIHERISDLSAEDRSYRFQHVRVPMPVRASGGIFTVTPGTDPGTSLVTLETTFEPLDPAGVDEVTGMIRGAFGQSLESLRRYVEEKVTWDAG
jgi:uncharacterized protein YndB with AHSA1/START domain